MRRELIGLGKRGGDLTGRLPRNGPEVVVSELDSAYASSAAPVVGRSVAFPDAGAASRALADAFVQAAEAAVAERGRFSVVLTGGGSPVAAYRLLGGGEYRERVPWRRTHLFWGDERCVPPAHPRSNFRMAWKAFVSRVPVPDANVHRMRGELLPARGRDDYARELERHFGGAPPVFDLVHLGVGEDGHVASLFPFSPLLREREQPVANALLSPLGEHRITLTLPVINAARRVEVLLFEEKKAPISRIARFGPRDPARLPVHAVHPAGELVWMVRA